MKYFKILITILFLVLLLSCSISSEPSPSISMPVKNKPEKIIVYYKENQNLDNSDWLYYIKNTYGLDLKPYVQKNNDGVSAINECLENKTTGLVYIWYSEFFNLLPNTNIKLYPVNDILLKNSTWKSLPENYQNNSLYNGKFIGIPSQYNEFGSAINVRLYNSGILNYLNLNTPETINDFYEFLLSARNTEKMEHLLLRTNENPFFDMGDIFMSYGVKTDYHSEKIISIIFDYKTNRYIDIAESKAMKQSLEFIRNLHKNNIVSISTNRSYPASSFYMGKTATTVDSLSQIALKNNFKADFGIGFLNIENNKIYVQQSKGLYVLVNSISEPPCCIEAFLDSFLINDKANSDAYLGNDDSKLREYGHLMIYNGNIMDEAPNLIGNILMPYQVISNKSNFNDSYIYSEDQLDKYNQLINDFYGKINTFNFLPLSLEDLFIRTRHNDYIDCFQNFALLIYNDNISLDEILFEYMKEMNTNGGTAYIEELNSNINYSP